MRVTYKAAYFIFTLFFFSRIVHNGTGTHAGYCPMGRRGYVPGDKADGACS